MLRGSREYGSRVNGSCTKKLIFSVLAARNGSMRAVSGSGRSNMSDSWIDWNPRIDEPSKAKPSSNTLLSKAEAGIVKCCMMPGRSQNRTSTYSTFSSLASLKTSSGVFSVTECSFTVSAADAMEPILPVSQPRVAQTLLTVPPTTDAGSPRPIVGPWSARS
ncbi:Uncharacterised protein [Mycobacterium tuberculosis]|uniref:Uncharacterized protein n=1 Tax=Mycobacterium tuberculosis TaxID=1773 RepID=A0A655AGD8_MYCTX|nr:Uncharacterised protein [Mycobacterium tuberculosis]CKS72160.1 Uncharacterised protein [Mycobacterium tuberculosis]CKT74020.1 Uncharacterised protein [Mycobacterium tuberculosis]